jgi:hypothetical protein
MTERPNTNEPVDTPEKTGTEPKNQPDPAPSDPPDGNTVPSDI